MGMTEELPVDEERTNLVAAAVRRRWPTIVLAGLLLAGGAAAYSSAGTPSYTAVAQVLVRPAPGNALSEAVPTSTSQTTVAMETEAALVTSPDVTSIAARRLGEDLDPGSPAVVASVPPNTQIVQVAYTAPTARAARDGAQAFAEAYLAYRSEVAEATLSYQATSLERQARAAEESLKDASRTAARRNPPPDAASQVQLFASRLAALQASIGELQTRDVRPGDLVRPAKLPPSPTGLSPAMIVLAGALLGLGAGVALAVWRERRDDRIRRGPRSTIRGVPVLADVAAQRRPQLVVDEDARPDLVNSYRRATVAVLAAVPRPAVVVVSSVTEDTPGAAAAVNTALALRQSGHHVALVDATGPDGGPTRLLGLPADPGLLDVLERRATLDSALQESCGMRVLTEGSATTGREQRVLGVEMTDLLEKLRGEFAYVVVAAPPATTAAGGAAALAGDALVLVATPTRTTHADLDAAVETTRQLGTEVLGVVLETPSPTDRRRTRARRAPTEGARSAEASLRTVFPGRAPTELPPRRARRQAGDRDFLLVPSASRPKLVVPAGPRAVTVSAIRRYRQVRGPRDRARRAATVLVVRCGFGGRVFGRARVPLAPAETAATLEAHLAGLLGRPAYVSLHLGPPRAVQKPVLQVMTAQGEVVGYAKLGVTPFTRELVRHEAEALRELAGRSWEHLVVPPVVHHGRWRGHELLVVGALEGSARAATPGTLSVAMVELARFRGVTTTSLAESTYWTRLGERLGALPATPIVDVLRGGAARIVAAHGATAVAFGSWHGDWTSWNMTFDADHALVWDWEKLEHDVPLGLDAVHHAVQDLVVAHGRRPAQAFDEVAGRAPDLLAPFDLGPGPAQVVVQLYALEVATRYVEDGEGLAGTTPMTRLAEWVPQVVGRGARAEA